MLLIAKAPLPGRAKTRLVPALGAEPAARLQEAMLLDTLDGCLAEVSDTGLLAASTTDVPRLRALVGHDVPISIQRGAGLADALLTGSRDALVGAGAVALVASDLPGIPPGALAGAIERLADGADVVLGPGVDGGYWLIALREAHAEPFARIPWSTGGVLAATLERCRAAGLRTALVEPWRDLDTPADLEMLARESETLPGRRTAALLRELAPSVAPESANCTETTQEVCTS